MRGAVFSTSTFLGGMIAMIGFLFFATKAIFVKLAYQYGIASDALLMLRMVFSLPFFLIVGRIAFTKKEDAGDVIKKNLSMIIFLGVLGYYIASLLDFKGLTYIDASFERVIVYIYPTLVVIISSFWYKTKITRNQIAAIIISYLGIIIAYGGNIATNTGDNVTLGTILVLGSAVTYAIFLVGSQHYTKVLGSGLYNAVVMIIACLAVIMHNLILYPETDYFHYAWQVYMYAFLMATLSTVIPSFMIMEGIKRIGAGNSAILGSTGPIATILMAAYLLDEKINLIQWLGSLIVIAGVVMVMLSKDVKSTESR